MKKIALAIALLFLLVTISYGDEQPFQLTIKLDKRVYYVGDEAQFTLTIKNNSEKNKYFYFSGIYEAQLFKIADGNGNIQPWETTVIYDVVGTKELYRLVEPGMDYSWIIKAKLSNKIKPIINFHDSMIKLSNFGKFNISTNYEGWNGITFDLNKEDIFIGTLTSNTITLEVMEKG